MTERAMKVSDARPVLAEMIATAQKNIEDIVDLIGAEDHSQLAVMSLLAEAASWQSRLDAYRSLREEWL